MNRLKEQINYAKFTENPNVTLDIDYAERLLLELTEQYESPTLEEVKKEWEELGYKWEEDLNYITLKPTLSGCWISIKKEKDYLFSNGCITLKIHQLLTKTFKALGWM